MKQLFESTELIGKTVSEIIMPKNHLGDMWIKFSDDSFVIIKHESYQEGYGSNYDYVGIEDMEQGAENSELLELGLITKKEYDDALIAQEKKYEQWRIENDQRQKKDQEQYEKSMLGKLKEKYEKPR